jgi:AcrR family transcriptional regulator
VSPRQYALGARSGAVAETRGRVVAAARSLISDKGFHRTSLDEVAGRADVARATVYHQFGSKIGVLEAVLTDFEERAGLPALIELLATAPADVLLRTTLTAGCDYWSTDPDLCRKVIGLAATDPEAAAVLAVHDGGRLRILTDVVSRLAGADQLNEDCSQETALDVLWLLTGFDTFDTLHRGRGLDTAATSDLLVRLATRQLGST